MFRVLLLLGVLNIVAVSNAQVTLEIEEKINDQLRKKNRLIDSTNISGFRIQIASSTARSEAKDSVKKFISIFPENADRIYYLYEQPHWEARIGDFYREIDAEKMLQDVRKHFPLALLVPDKIRRPKIE